MKRDMELVRHILLELEKKEDPKVWLEKITFNNCTPEQISYHVEIMYQAGLIDARERQAIGLYQWFPMNLTWQGHEFLDAARNESIWNKAKNKVAEVSGGWSLELMKMYLIHEAKRQLGIES